MISHILYTNGLVMPVNELGRLADAHGIDYLIHSFQVGDLLPEGLWLLA